VSTTDGHRVHPLAEGNGKPPGTTSWSGSVTELGSEMRSYYGRPVIKQPIWKWEIPVYFFTGGLGGASAVLGSIARRRRNEELANAALWISFASESVSPLLLIGDLGRPERFHHMFRVFKVTSPMNVGSWLLGASATASGVAAGAHAVGRRRVRDAAEAVSALLGLPLATYTAVLVSDTAIPAWHEARRELPFVFASSSAASAGAAAAIVVDPERAAPARRVAVAGVLATNVASVIMEKRLGTVAEPYEQGEAGRFHKLARGLTLAGGAVLAVGGRRRPGAVLGGALVLAGEVCLRWSIYKAGFQSASDPRYTVEPQRKRVDEASVVRRAQSHGDRAGGAGDPAKASGQKPR
jgi:formate-dependent nitrite reductase membrane component NrfD